MSRPPALQACWEREPITLDLGLSDTQLGLLTGFAFAFFHAFLGMPIARIADRGNRRTINEMFGWRAAFFIVGVPGLPLALVVRFTVQEPARGMAEGRSAESTQPTVGETFRYLLAKRSFRHLALGGALTAFVGYPADLLVPRFGADSRRYALPACSVVNVWAAAHYDIAGEYPGTIWRKSDGAIMRRLSER